MEDDTYEIEFLCRNCGESGVIDVPLGTKIEDMPCPHCRVKALVLRSPSSR